MMQGLNCVCCPKRSVLVEGAEVHMKSNRALLRHHPTVDNTRAFPKRREATCNARVRPETLWQSRNSNYQ